MHDMVKSLVIYTDGGSRGNPGTAASAFIIIDEKGKVLEEYSEYIGHNTNNVAEYKALIKALHAAVKFKPKEVTCYSDSEVMVKQLNGEYKISAEHLRRMSDEVKSLSKNFKKISFLNVRRTNAMIQKADALVNRCLDENADKGYTFRDDL